MGQMISSVRNHLAPRGHNKPVEADKQNAPPSNVQTDHVQAPIDVPASTHPAARPQTLTPQRSMPLPIPNATQHMRHIFSSPSREAPSTSSSTDGASTTDLHAPPLPRSADSSPRTRMARFTELRMTATAFLPGRPLLGDRKKSTR